VKWATHADSAVARVRSILLLEYPMIAKGAKYSAFPDAEFGSQQLPFIVHLNVSHWLAVHDNGQASTSRRWCFAHPLDATLARGRDQALGMAWHGVIRPGRRK
jgi:hypothetical protein